jgi:hypothetical protein
VFDRVMRNARRRLVDVHEPWQSSQLFQRTNAPVNKNIRWYIAVVFFFNLLVNIFLPILMCNKLAVLESVHLPLMDLIVVD